MALLLVFSNIYAGEETLWDLGVTIDYDRQHITQKELDIKTLDNTYRKGLTSKHIKALHSNSFIEPILHEIKNPTNNNQKIKPVKNHL